MPLWLVNPQRACAGRRDSILLPRTTGSLQSGCLRMVHGLDMCHNPLFIASRAVWDASSDAASCIRLQGRRAAAWCARQSAGEARHTAH